MKDVLTPIEMRAVDKNTEYNHIPTLVLMENAGASIAKYIVEHYPDKKKISIYSGTGGNGGDGFVVARHLLNYGYKVHLLLLSKPENIKNKDALINWKSIEVISNTTKNLKTSIITDSEQLTPDNSDIIIDALLGTGVNGKIRQPTSKAIDNMNYSPAIRISIDVPSGLNPETGLVKDKSVIAHTTLTLHKKKTGLVTCEERYTGVIEVLDLGIPQVSEEYTGSGDLLKLRKPEVTSHKGDNGSVLIIGSNTDYIGAVIFAAEACISQGVDLVYIVVPETSASIIKQYNPEYIVRSIPGSILSMDGFELIEPLIERVDSILIGSGSGINSKTGELFNNIVKSVDKPVIIDADALKLVDKENIKKGNVVLTPHAREFETFFSSKLPKKLEAKRELLQNLSIEYNTTILLKGVVDIITCPSDYKLNSTGNQGMTVGGTGDILAGLTTAISTKNSLFESAYIASFIIGCAGDEALDKYGFKYSSKDILEFL
ncbi:NAD(P)H-hydrate dehydratase [Methanosphaera sp.]